ADAISQNKLRSAIGYEHILKKHFGEILDEMGATAIAHHYRILARLYWNAGQNQKAFRYLLAAVARSPLTFFYTNRYTSHAHWNMPGSGSYAGRNLPLEYYDAERAPGVDDKRMLGSVCDSDGREGALDPAAIPRANVDHQRISAPLTQKNRQEDPFALRTRRN